MHLKSNEGVVKRNQKMTTCRAYWMAWYSDYCFWKVRGKDAMKSTFHCGRPLPWWWPNKKVKLYDIGLCIEENISRRYWFRQWSWKYIIRCLDTRRAGLSIIAETHRFIHTCQNFLRILYVACLLRRLVWWMAFAPNLEASPTFFFMRHILLLLYVRVQIIYLYFT